MEEGGVGDLLAYHRERFVAERFSKVLDLK